MRKILIDNSIEAAQALIKKRTVFCTAAAAAAVLLNLLFTALRTEGNHYVMLLLNIAVDLAAGFFITYYASFHILPLKKRLKFSLRPAQMLRGTVTEVSGDTTRVLGFDCYAVTVGGRKVFLPDCSSLCPEVGREVTLGIVMNLVTEAEQ